MLPGFPKTEALGDVNVKRVRKQQRMISNRQKKGLRRVTEPFGRV
jgi:hypothetical protein